MTIEKSMRKKHDDLKMNVYKINQIAQINSKIFKI